MPTNVNCQCFNARTGKCLHVAAPKTIFGNPKPCLLDYANTDPRIKSCALQYPYVRPNFSPPPPPPGRVIVEGKSVQFLDPPPSKL